MSATNEIWILGEPECYEHRVANSLETRPQS